MVEFLLVLNIYFLMIPWSEVALVAKSLLKNSNKIVGRHQIATAKSMYLHTCG